jgi:hypothetical protein
MVLFYRMSCVILKNIPLRKIIQTIEESRESQEWLLAYFEKACAHLKEIKVVCFCQALSGSVARRLSR